MRICVKVPGMMTGTEEVLRKALLNQKRWEDQRIKKERKTGIDFSQEFFHKVISYYVYPGWGQYNPKCPYKWEIAEICLRPQSQEGEGLGLSVSTYNGPPVG